MVSHKRGGSAGEQSDESDGDPSDGDKTEQDSEHCFGYGCLLVTISPKPLVATTFTNQTQVDKETARRVTQDVFAVGDSLWTLGDASFDHDDL
jgi:hypothetical protein